MQECVVKIFSKKEDFLDDLVNFFFRKSLNFKRNYHINNILNNSISLTDEIKNLSPIKLDEVFGSTFQSTYRKNEQIYATTHTISEIDIRDDGFFAKIKPSDYGEIIDFQKGVLRPVYFRYENEPYKIATFDIDFNITQDVS